MKAVMSRPDAAAQRQAVAKAATPPGTSGLLSNVSIVIPVAPEDESWRSLIGDLVQGGLEAELLVVATRPMPTDASQTHLDDTQNDIRWTVAASGRAHQMNHGASLATRQFLWFLHADSRVSTEALLALERSLSKYPHSLHFFDVAFQKDGPGLVRMNAWGVRFRSHCLRLPFGDQGLCMSREVFRRLGGFDDSVAYGEDHLLVWAAHRERVPLCRVKAFITTSARKYRTNGWLPTTLLHGWRTWRQALPELVKLLRRRFS